MRIIFIIIVVLIVLGILIWDHVCFTKDEGDTENKDDDGEERRCYHTGDW